LGWLATLNISGVLKIPDVNSLSEDQLKTLINGCIGNHRKSQEHIYKMFYGKMMAVCRRYTNNEDQAKDILQDGFIKLFKSLEKFNFVGSFEGWVRRIMVNTAIDYVRKSKNDFLLANENQSVEDSQDTIMADEEVEEPVEMSLNVNDVRTGMEQLSTAYRTVFNLYVFENFSHQDIADALEISVGTSKSNLAKARANLKKILTKELDKRNGTRTEPI
jgi:RNA polymerase sigma-70 factor (ECF subfamily)